MPEHDDDLDSAPPPLPPPPAGLDDEDDDDATVSDEGEDASGGSGDESGEGSSADDTDGDTDREGGDDGEEEGDAEERDGDSEGDGGSSVASSGVDGDGGDEDARSPPPSPSAAATSGDDDGDGANDSSGSKRRRGHGGRGTTAVPPPPMTAEPADEDAARSEAAHALRVGRNFLREREVTVHTFLFDDNDGDRDGGDEGAGRGSLGASVDQNGGGGCTVSDVLPGGLADRLGVAPGDILFSAATSTSGGGPHDEGGDGDFGSPRQKRRRRDDDDDNNGEQGPCGGDSRPVDERKANKVDKSKGGRPRKFQPTAIRFEEFLSLVANDRRSPLRITVIRVSETPAERTDRLLREAQDAKAEADVAKTESEAEIVSAREAIEEAKRALERAKQRYDRVVETDKANAERVVEAGRYLEDEWTLQKRPDWDVMYGRLCRYKEENGHTWVKKPMGKRMTKKALAERDAGGFGEEFNRDQIVEERFGAWVEAQRREYRTYLEASPEERERATEPCSTGGGGRSTTQRLTPERVRRLDEIGFVATWREHLDGHEWWEMYRKLSEFRLRHGHVNINKGSRKDDVLRELFQWSTVQRQRHGTGNLPADKVEALERVGFRFDEDGDGGNGGGNDAASWDSMFDRLRRFYEVNGHTDVPTTREDEKDLAAWAMKQRRLQRSVRDKLSPERHAKLCGLGFVWNINESKWNQRFAELLDYRDEFGDCDVRGVPGPHFDLGMWAQRMRGLYTNLQDGEHHSTLTEEKIEKLESVGFRWTLRAHRPREATMKSEEQIWDERYLEMKAFFEKYGHCRILSKKIAASATSNRLKHWIALQRRQYKDFQAGRPTPMNTERVRLLEELRFDFNPIKGRKYYDD